jgi:16S rRNA (guanine1516-N2)-methyltransferase
MALVAVEALDEGARDLAADWARSLGVAGPGEAGASAAVTGVKLIVGSGGIGLAFADKKRGKPYFVDFLTASWRARFNQPLARNHIFRRALGAQKDGEPLHILDATAGFGQDALLALSLGPGCRVVAVERSPVVAMVLRDGLERAAREDALLREKLKRFEVVEMDAAAYLAVLPPERSPDVVYLDPMFQKPKKSAKSPKEMQLLQELFDGASALSDDDKLFAAAWSAARRRVVVKRPLKARAIKSAPAHSFKGQSIRYDVYVKG